MSTPRNPLDIYRTYSYYHILIACENTGVAEFLSESGEIQNFQRVFQGGRYAAREIIGTEVPGKYVVIINGSTDAQFVISSVKWATMIAPSTEENEISSYNSFAVDGEMEIMEALGVRFLNVLANAGKALNTDANALIYLLKTVFVGHTHTGGTSTFFRTKPLLFTPYDIVSESDQTGSRYTLSFVGVNDGAAKLPQASRIAEGITLKVPNKKITVKSFIENELKQAVQEKYNDYIVNLKKFVSDNKLDIPVDEFRRIEYDFKVDGYEDAFVGSNTLEQQQSTGKESDAQIALGRSPNIEHLIQQVLDSSVEVMDKAKAKDKDGKSQKRVIAKIQSTIDTAAPEITASSAGSDTTTGKSNLVYKIVYRIWEFEPPTRKIKDKKEIDPKPGEFIEWDYIYTGKNIDVIDFKIKMEMGMAFFQMLNTSQSQLQQSETLAGIPKPQLTSGQGGTTKGNPTNDFNTNTPLFPGTNIKETLLRNKRFPVSTNSYKQLLKRHAAYENVGVNLTIRGNPQLLSELILMPSEIVTGVLKAAKNSESTGLARWTTTPGLAKLNIKMPAASQTDGFFAESFWYDGFFTILSVDNVFSDGMFTQELELYSIPLMDELSDVDDTQADKQPSADTSTTSTTKTQSQNAASKVIVETPKDKSDKRSQGSDPTETNNDGDEKLRICERFIFFNNTGKEL